jgi:uncharacterized protein
MVRKTASRCLALLVCLLAFTGAFAESVKSLPRPTDYVSDFAHVMSPSAKQRINLLCGQVERQARAQIAVVIVNSLDGVPVADYAVQLEDAWGVGPKNSDRGAILLIAVKDRQRYISTGYGLEGILPDSVVGDIGRRMVPYLRANDFDGAVTLGVDQMAQIIAQDAGVTLTPLTRRTQQQVQPQPIHISLGRLIFFGIVLIFIVIFLARTGGGGLIGFLIGMFLGGGGRGGGWGGGGGGGDDGGSGFGGFGGGRTGGGGAGGDW